MGWSRFGRGSSLLKIWPDLDLQRLGGGRAAAGRGRQMLRMPAAAGAVGMAPRGGDEREREFLGERDSWERPQLGLASLPAGEVVGGVPRWRLLL